MNALHISNLCKKYKNDFVAFNAVNLTVVTGHTGFKGSWLCMWLHALGAQVKGFALA